MGGHAVKISYAKLLLERIPVYPIFAQTIDGHRKNKGRFPIIFLENFENDF